MRDFVRLSLEAFLEVMTLKSCHNLNLEFRLCLKKKKKTFPGENTGNRKKLK